MCQTAITVILQYICIFLNFLAEFYILSGFQNFMFLTCVEEGSLSDMLK